MKWKDEFCFRVQTLHELVSTEIPESQIEDAFQPLSKATCRLCSSEIEATASTLGSKCWEHVSSIHSVAFLCYLQFMKDRTGLVIVNEYRKELNIEFGNSNEYLDCLSTFVNTEKGAKMKCEWAEQDIGSIVFLEHINLTIDMKDREVASSFYFDGLKFAKDPFFNSAQANRMMWANVGRTQIHIPLNGPRQSFKGTVGIIVDNLHDIRQRLERLINAEGMDISIVLDRSEEEADQLPRPSNEFLTVNCPFGNTFKLYQANNSWIYGGLPAELGLAYIEHQVPFGCAVKIGVVYETYFDAPVRYCRNGALVTCRVAVGPWQEFVFSESREDKVEYQGHHVCIYVTNFSSSYRKMSKKGLIWNNPRFKDKCDTYELALKEKQYRFKDFVCPITNEKVFELEHEVRSLYHPSFMRTLVNRSGKTGIHCVQ
eukprot:Nk52_evm94s1810 gene=Nk52_evmTU94s1810